MMLWVFIRILMEREHMLWPEFSPTLSIRQQTSKGFFRECDALEKPAPEPDWVEHVDRHQ